MTKEVNWTEGHLLYVCMYVCIIGITTITRQNGSLFSTELDLGKDHELEVGDFGPNNMPDLTI